MDKKTYTGYQQHRLTIPMNSTSQIEYREVKPNYFRISNHGSGTLYAATSGYPTQQKYDFKIDGFSSRVFNEPFESERIYIFNPSVGEDIHATVTSFYAPFDPTVFALGELGMDIQGQIETDGIVKGFTAELPQGDNKIGSVSVDNLSEVNENITDIYAYFMNGSGARDIFNSFEFILTDIKNALPESGEYIAEERFLPGEPYETINAKEGYYFYKIIPLMCASIDFATEENNCTINDKVLNEILPLLKYETLKNESMDEAYIAIMRKK